MKYVVILVALMVGGAWMLAVFLAGNFGWLIASVPLLLVVGAFYFVWRRWVAGVWACSWQRGKADDARCAGDFDGCKRILLNALEMASGTLGANRAEIHADLGDLFIELEQWEKALEHLRAAMAAVEGDRPRHRLQIGQRIPELLIQVLGQLDKWAEVEQFVRERLPQATGLAAADVNQELAAALVKQDRPNEAIEYLQEAARLLRDVPDDGSSRYPRALQMLGITASIAKQSETAMSAFKSLEEHVRQLPEDHPDRVGWRVVAAYGLARAYSAAGSLEEAAVLLEQTIVEAVKAQMSEYETACLCDLGEVLLKMRRFVEARARASQALQLWEAEQSSYAEKARELLKRIDEEALIGAGLQADAPIFYEKT